MEMVITFLRRNRVASVVGEAIDDVVTVDQDLTMVGRVAVPHGPIGDIAVDADGKTIVVTNYGANSVSVINPDTLAVEETVAVVGEPFAAAVADDRAFVTTASASYDSVTVIDTNTKTVLAAYPLAFSVTAVTASPDGKRVYAGRTGRDRVDLAVIDITAERVGSIDVANGPGINIDAVRVDAEGRRLYIATSDVRGSELVVVNAETARTEATVWIGSPIRDMALGADGTAYVLSSDRARGGVVDMVDPATNKITDSVEIGGAPTQLALSPDGTRAYIVDCDDVVVMCTLTSKVLDRITVGAQPSCLAVGPGDDRLYIADYSGGVTVFSIMSPMPPLYSHFLTTAPVAVAARLPERERAPA